MPVIQPPQQSANVFPRIARWVEAKQTWAGSWAPLPYWVPLRARIEVAPGHGSLSASHWLGNVKPEGSPTKQLFLPQDLTDWYCRAMLCRVGGQPVAVWTGIIPDSTIVVDSPTVGRTQGIEAFGLTWLLDRQPITTSYANQNGTLTVVDYPMVFNRRNGGRGLSLSGNRSAEKDATLGCYVFQGGEDGCREWSNLDIAEYLLKTQNPSIGVQFELAGMTDALDSTKNEWPQNGTCWQMLSKLIDRRHGLTFFPRVLDSGKVQLWITSEVETAINYGGVTLPPNPVQVSFTLPTTGVDQHLPLDVVCRFTAIAQYNELIIRGMRLIVMATFSNMDGTLTRGWKTSLATDYRLSTSLSDPRVADEGRKVFKFEDVFTKFIVPPAWNGNVLNGLGGGSPKPVTPTPNDDGTLDFTTQGEFLRAFKLFERELTIEKGKRYDTDPITNETETGSEPEFRPVMAAIMDDFDGANHKGTSKFIRLDKLGGGLSGLHNLSVATLDKDLGFRIVCHPQHYIAGDEWDAADVTEVLPEIDWTRLVITACITTDVRPNIRIQLSPTGENEKTKVIDVDGAEFWYAIEDTVIDVDHAGLLVRINDANKAIRDDVEKLQAYAAFARVWYGTPRQAVSIPIQTIGVWVELGTYLTGISNVYTWLSVGTVVTNIEWDFAANNGGGVTTITTGHGDDDVMIEPVEFVGRRKGRRSGR